jgi:hypothetical protein
MSKKTLINQEIKWGDRVARTDFPHPSMIQPGLSSIHRKRKFQQGKAARGNIYRRL